MTMDLLQVDNGKWVKVLRYAGGGGLDLKMRSMGLLPGDYARVIRQAPFGGPVLVEIDGRSIALGRGSLQK
jgi:ferrous iron transport protein A